MTNTAATTGGQNELLALGWQQLRAGDHKGAQTIADQLARGQPTPDSLLFAGEVQFALGNFAGTEEFARRAIGSFPDDVGAGVLLCRALMALGRPGEARDAALELATRDVTDDNQVEVLSMVLSGLMEADAAYHLCKGAVDREPDNMRAKRRLALTCRLVGRLDEARDAASAVIRGNPHDYEMIGLRSAVSNATLEQNNIDFLEDLLEAGCQSAFGAARVAYALAKENEELENFDRSFRYVAAGAEFKKHTFPNYRIDRDLEILGNIEKAFSADMLAVSAPGHPTEEPLFILGLPRTGSSLLERIMSSHPDVYAAGELLHLNSAMVAELKRIGAPVDSDGQLSKIAECDPARIGKTYLDMTRPLTGHSRFFIDKRPLNSLLIGVIAMAMPNAKIIHVRRTPLDACFAIYKFLFNEAYPWSYDLDEIARYYIAYRRLMDHWRNVLPDRIIDVAYEDVVNNIEVEARQLVDRLGLEWNPACLRFYENQAAAMTGSAAQVRKQLYSSSVGRWREYEKELEYVAFAIETAGFDPYTP